MSDFTLVTLASGRQVYLPAELSVTASGLLDDLGTTQGSVIYRGALVWAALTPGNSGQALESGGAGADPSWTDPPLAFTPADFGFLSGCAQDDLVTSRGNAIAFDGAANERATANLWVPPAYRGATVKCTIVVSPTAVGANAARFRVLISDHADGAAPATSLVFGYENITLPAVADELQHHEFSASRAVGSGAAFLGIQVQRDGGAGGDTDANDVKFEGGFFTIQ